MNKINKNALNTAIEVVTNAKNNNLLWVQNGQINDLVGDKMKSFTDEEYAKYLLENDTDKLYSLADAVNLSMLTDNDKHYHEEEER